MLASGDTDASRPVLYSGQTQLLTPAGVLPLSFEMQNRETIAPTLGEAQLQAGLLAGLIGLVILWGAFRIVKEAGDVLLEAVPEGIDLQEVEDAVKAVDGVEDVHDVHIWTITSGIYALSAHVRVDDRMVSASNALLVAIDGLLEHRFTITHATLQLECDACSTDAVCTLPNGHSARTPAGDVRVS